MKLRKHRIPRRINQRKNEVRHVIIKLTKKREKEKNIKSTREEQQITYKRTPVRIIADLSAETM